MLAVAALVGTPGCGDKAASDQPDEISTEPDKLPVAIIDTTQGKIFLKFFPKAAPDHVNNFLYHSKSGYYKNTYFHRVSPNFMIQGGDPNTKDSDPRNDGLGGHSYRGPNTFLSPEFSRIPHRRGIVSMARGQAPASAGSQFFIVTRDSSMLDGQYSVFGEVISGMDVVDEIAKQPGADLGQGCVNPQRHQYINDIKIEYWTKEEIAEKEKYK
jgi:peptidyl-prolyl cis-trans isomerase B (cyclophilin B)